MSETREVFEMVTKQTEPDLGSWREQERRQRKRAQRRKAGVFVVVAALVVAGGMAFALQDDDTTSGVADQPTQSPLQTVSPETEPIASAYVGIVDLATGDMSTIPIVPSASAIDVSPDGSQIAYVNDDVVKIADSTDRTGEGSRGRAAIPEAPSGPLTDPASSTRASAARRSGTSTSSTWARVRSVGSPTSRAWRRTTWTTCRRPSTRPAARSCSTCRP